MSSLRRSSRKRKQKKILTESDDSDDDFSDESYKKNSKLPNSQYSEAPVVSWKVSRSFAESSPDITPTQILTSSPENSQEPSISKKQQHISPILKKKSENSVVSIDLASDNKENITYRDDLELTPPHVGESENSQNRNSSLCSTTKTSTPVRIKSSEVTLSRCAIKPGVVNDNNDDKALSDHKNAKETNISDTTRLTGKAISSSTILSQQKIINGKGIEKKLALKSSNPSRATCKKTSIHEKMNKNLQEVSNIDSPPAQVLNTVSTRYYNPPVGRLRLGLSRYVAKPLHPNVSKK